MSMWVLVLAGPEMSDLPGAWLKSSCEVPDMAANSQAQVFRKSSVLLTTEPSLQPL